MGNKSFRELLEGESPDMDMEAYQDEDAFGGLDFDELCMLFFAEVEDDEIPERLQELYQYIMDDVEDYWNEGESDGEMEEALRAKRVKRSVSDRMKARREYRKNKAKIKRKQKQRRQKPEYKRYLKKKKRMDKRGRTSTGKRKKTYY